jgi:hypothetical protein
MSNLHFDRCQFEGRGAYPVNAKNGIAFEDYGRMHCQQRSTKPAAWVPPFAMNDAQLQKVLLIRAWKYVHGGRKIIPDIVDSLNRDEINAAATVRALRGHTIRPDAPARQHEAHAMHQESVRRAGGFLQLQAAIAFRSWRLGGMDSVAVAETLGTTPQAVRVVLWRMRDIAKLLGFDVGAAGYTAGMKRTATPKRKRFRSSPPKPTLQQRIITLYNSGVPIPEIALQVGLQKYKSRLRSILRSAGYPIPFVKKTHQPGAEIVTGDNHKREFSAPRAVALYKAGWRIIDIAVEMGYRRGQGQNRVLRYLRIAGAYPAMKSRAA